MATKLLKMVVLAAVSDGEVQPNELEAKVEHLDEERDELGGYELDHFLEQVPHECAHTLHAGALLTTKLHEALGCSSLGTMLAQAFVGVV